MSAVMSYSLNKDNARKVGESTAITEKGAYVGFFTRAEALTSKKGTQGIEFDFKSNDGAVAKYMTVWTIGADGNDLSGRQLVDAVLASMGVLKITAADAMVKKWNNETRKDEDVRATVFPELMNRAVGVVLQREEYETQAGERKWKNALVCPFVAETRCTAGERLDKKPAVALDRILERLTDRPLKATAQRAAYGGTNYARPAPSQSSTGGAQPSSGFDDMSDDIPF